MYGIDIYLGSGIKLLSTSEMGVAFDIQKNGENVDYNGKPNCYSQVEFPTSPIMGYWADTEQGIIDQFNALANAGGIGKICKSISRQLVDNTYYKGGIKYTNGHITYTTANLLGLTNTIGSPASPLIKPPAQNYGLWDEGSLLDLLQDVSAYRLKSNFIKRSHRMWKKVGAHMFDSPTMHLLIIPTQQDEIAALYPADFSKPFSIGLYAKAYTHEIYVIFSEADYIDMQVQIYSRYPGGAVYSDYGLETYRADGSIAFSSKNPPLLPIFVTNSESINLIPPANYRLGCVFSRVDTFVHAQWKDIYSGTPACVFNGISWVSGSKWSSELMGFTDGGDAYSSSSTTYDYIFWMGTFDLKTWDYIVSIPFSVTGDFRFVQFSLPRFAKENKADFMKIGTFMGVVMY